ncbi:uncharacterized protein PGRI_076600 [Penicillium griseofulvum]|uniref:Uncharacterized protein n=1 Tax=Penicillium patulum TaxID=5078 RepID=A0A135LZX1_PENPA|nr:uncharacterized protein PGRI_076600 [Penicillium griseofulvum]KXG54516.1 hypothetical protein PGRI_076600 [Penicillium griseofulvum]
MSERVARNFGLSAMTPDGKVSSSTNPKYNNFNSDLETNALRVSIDFINLELRIVTLDDSADIDLIDLDSEIKVTRGAFIDPSDDPAPVISSCSDLIDLRSHIETTNPNDDTSPETEDTNIPRKRTTDLINLDFDNVIPVDMDMVHSTYNSGVDSELWCYKSTWNSITSKNLLRLNSQNEWLGLFGLIDWWFDHVDLENYEDDDYIE